jgi:HEAT repeat protein
MKARGIELTFDVLRSSRNPAALAPLLAAVDSPNPHIQRLAVRALLARREAEGHRAVLTRSHCWPEDLRQIVWEHRSRLSGTVRDLVLSSDFEESLRGLEAALWLREYDLAPVLVNMLISPTHSSGAVVAAILQQLAEALAAECAASQPAGRVPAPETLRQHFLHSLARGVERFGEHQYSEILLAFLLLVDSNHPLLLKVLNDPGHSAHRRMCELLLKNGRPEIIRLLLGLLCQPEVPAAVLRIVSRRSDVNFVKQLLDWVNSANLSEASRNLTQIRQLPWLESLEEILPQLNSSQQLAVIQLIQSCGLRRCQILEVFKHILRWGEPAARKAAVQSLEAFSGPHANMLITLALNDPHPEVQAEAVRQLRQRGIVGALPRLVALLDSPEPLLRQAAQESLQEFRFERYLAAFDLLEPEIRRSTATLVRKVDPAALPKLQAEMQSPVRARRLRAVAMAEAMDLLAETEDELIRLTEDPDHMVRAEAVRVLGRLDTPKSKEAIRKALFDRAPIVQQAAQMALQEEISHEGQDSPIPTIMSAERTGFVEVSPSGPFEASPSGDG